MPKSKTKANTGITDKMKASPENETAELQRQITALTQRNQALTSENALLQQKLQAAEKAEIRSLQQQLRDHENRLAELEKKTVASNTTAPAEIIATPATRNGDIADGAAAPSISAASPSTRPAARASKNEMAVHVSAAPAAASAPPATRNPMNGMLASRTREFSRIPSALQEVHLEQSRRVMPAGAPLTANLPLVVHAHLQLPATPSEEALSADTDFYSIHVVALDLRAATVKAENSMVGKLTAGVRNYENDVSLPELAPGKYVFNVHTVVPAARVGETKKFEVLVQ